METQKHFIFGLDTPMKTRLWKLTNKTFWGRKLMKTYKLYSFSVIVCGHGKVRRMLNCFYLETVIHHRPTIFLCVYFSIVCEFELYRNLFSLILLITIFLVLVYILRKRVCPFKCVWWTNLVSSLCNFFCMGSIYVLHLCAN